MEYQYIDTAEQLQTFAEENKNITWIAFDTEFVGEKRFAPLLCLIQAVTEIGVYVIDPITINDISCFLQMVENEAIVKITHAGDNDYRVLNAVFGTMPKNIFDTQVAAGFLTNTYPISFQKLIEKELQIKISKAFTVTDWETRPISPKQLKYAFNDVIYLPKLWKTLTERLEKLNRLHWVQQELAKQLKYAFNDVIYLPKLWKTLTERLEKLNRLHWVQQELAKLETLDYYEIDPMKEALQSNLTSHLAPREQLFLIRLLAWRRDEAKRKNYSKEMILPTKTISMIVKNINEGKSALKQNRVISDKTIVKHWDTFNELFQAKITDEEKQWLTRIPHYEEETAEETLRTEFLYLLIRHTCMKKSVAHSIVMSKSALKANGDDDDFINSTLNKGWRKELLGENLIKWITDKQLLDFEVFADECHVKKV